MAVEFVGIVSAVLCLAVAVTTVWISVRFLDIRNGGVLIVLLLTPVVVYLVVSGRIGELRGPGGLEAKFLSVARQPIQFAERRVEASVQPVQLTARGSSAELPRKLAELDPFEPVILTVTLGQQYNRLDWLRYVEALLGHPSFKMAVLLDRQKRFIAYMTIPSIREILANAALGGELIQRIAAGSVEEIRLFRSVQTETISPESTAIDALRKLKASEADFLLVVDKDRKIQGIVDQEDIVSQIILDLAEGTVAG